MNNHPKMAIPQKVTTTGIAKVITNLVLAVMTIVAGIISTDATTANTAVVQPVVPAQNLSTNTTMDTSAISLLSKLINATTLNATQPTIDDVRMLAMKIINSSSLSNKTATKVLDIPSQIETTNKTTALDSNVTGQVPQPPTPSSAPPPLQYDTFTLIDNDFQLGKIDLDTKIKYYVFALFDIDKLPSKYRSDQIAIDGTTVILEIQDQFKKLKPQTQEELAKYNIIQPGGSIHSFDRAPNCVSGSPVLPNAMTSAAGHFKLHFTLSGTHAVPPADVNPPNNIPDYVERVSEDLERSWLIASNYLWELPRPDGPSGDPPPQVNNLIDVYFYDTVPILGAAVRHSVDPSTINPNDFIGYMCIDNNLVTKRATTAAHEFFHLVQFAYNGQGISNDALWMRESTAVWFEDEVFDIDNDYVFYVSEFLSKPDLSLTSTFGTREYGASIWHRFVSDQYGDDVIRNMWTYASQAPGPPQATGARFIDNIKAIEDVTQSGNWQEAFYAFAVNNLFTDNFDYPRGSHFRAEEANFWPRVDINGRHTYTGTQLIVGDNDATIQGGGTDYVTVITGPFVPSVTIEFIGVDHVQTMGGPTNWMVSLALVDKNQPRVIINDFPLNEIYFSAIITSGGDTPISPRPPSPFIIDLIKYASGSITIPYNPGSFDIGVIIRNQGDPNILQGGSWQVRFHP